MEKGQRGQILPTQMESVHRRGVVRGLSKNRGRI